MYNTQNEKNVVLKVGLTGNIGSGKSTAARFFAELGVPVFDADKIGHELLEKNKKIQKLITKEFGREILENGQISRQKLSVIVFNDPVKLAALEEILHPEIIRELSARARSFHNKPYSIAEATLIYEARLSNKFDYIIVVTADENTAIKRAAQNLKKPVEEIEKRMKTQIPQSEKEKLADFVISNNGSVENLKAKVRLIHSILLSLATQKS
ncbi:MAG: dephospho-CoA kinase [Candidatus Kryptoniota bacterium]